MEKCKCSECGYLAVRCIETRVLYEAEEEFREKAVVPNYNKGKFELLPTCFRNAHQIRKEPQTNDREAVVAVINKERSCEAFTTWQQGFSPKEHLEMDLFERQAQKDKEREQMLREWRKEDIEIAKSAMSVTIRSYVVAAVIGGLFALAAVALAKLL